jgi:serine/threonine protein kinase
VCIADWSSARAHDAEPAPYVVTSESWNYTAPELASGGEIDERADVFALGVIAYEMLADALPYENRAVATAADGSVQHVPMSLRCPELPRELTALIDRMLAYASWERPSSTDVHEELSAIIAQMSQASRASSTLRIRRPRWTPPLPFEDPMGMVMRHRASVHGATTDRLGPPSAVTERDEERD